MDAGNRLGVDSSEAALAYARRNSERLGLAPRAHFQRGDWAEEGHRSASTSCCAIRPMSRRVPCWDGVAEHEPAEALFGGTDGLDDYRLLAPEIARLLAPGGLAAIEIGFDQGSKRGSPCSPRRALEPAIAHDLGGRPRALLIRLGDRGLGKAADGRYIVGQRSALRSRPKRSPTYAFVSAATSAA
jgi:release factor glutamine methyltransferase